MSFRRRDSRYGPHFYAPVGFWEEEHYGEITDAFTNESTRINKLFSHIYFPFKTLTSVGAENIEYLDCGVALADIIDTYLQLYDERLVAFPYYPADEGVNDGNRKSDAKIYGAITAVLNENYWKYAKLIQTLGLVYDPIENYNMTEDGDDTTTHSGTYSKDHNVNATKIGSIKVNGVVNPTISTDPTTGQKDIDIQFVDEATKITRVDGGTDTRAGQQVGRADVSEGVGQPIPENGTPVQSKNYTTTMDDASNGRLHNYQDQLGTTAQMLHTDTSEGIPIMGEITAGNPAFASYTDTEISGTYDEQTGEWSNLKTESTDHNLSRSGNIGVTTSQQMIEQERKIVRFSVLREFFDDINKELLLKVW